MPKPEGKASGWDFWTTIMALVSVAGFICLALILLTGVARMKTLPLWGVLAGLIILLLLSIGYKANGKWYGALIDVRNRVSLSRMQIIFWTIIVVSVYLAIGLTRAMPHALKQPTAAEIQQCKTDFLKNSEAIDDIDRFTLKDQAAAAAALDRANDHCTLEPLKIYFPPELLLALGISTASFAGSTLIQSKKRSQSPVGLITEIKKKMEEAEKNLKAKEETLNQLRNKLGMLKTLKADAVKMKAAAGRTPDEQRKDQMEIDRADLQLSEITPQFEKAEKEYNEAKAISEKLGADWEIADTKKEGLLKVNASPREASLNDLFQGDEIGNYQLIDLSKVQMFFFTFAVIISYGVTLGSLVENSTIVLHPFGVSLPAFSTTLNALLGISHAGYLTVKSVGHTKTE